MILFFFSCQSNPIIEDTYSSVIQEDSESDTSIDAQRYVLTSLLYLNKRGRLFIFDRENQQQQWALENNSDPVWQDARLTLDGQFIIHNECDVVNHDLSKAYLVRVAPDGTEQQRISAPGTHHSVDIIEEDLLVSLEYDVRNIETYGKVAGDQIVLYRNGNREALLSSFDVLVPSPVTDMWEHGFFPDAHDWTHANAVRWYPDTEQLLVTIPGLNALWSIDLDGRVKTVYLGRFTSRNIYEQGPMYQDSPYDIIDGGTFDMPHGATMDSQGRLWVMSNGLGNEAESTAQGYEIIDGQLQLFREIQIPIEGARSPGLGSVEYLEETNTVLVNWGILGVLEEVDENDQRLWQIETDLGEVLGMSTTFANLPQGL